MYSMVYKVFKTIAFAIIFVFVFDIMMYIYRFASFNTKVENISTSLQKVVMENNYLPKEQAVLFKQMLYNLAADYNAPTAAARATYTFNIDDTGLPWHDTNNAFVLYCDWNYAEHATFPSGTSPIAVFDPTGNIVLDKMGVGSSGGQVGDYGDIMVVQIRFLLAQPMWNCMHETVFNNGGDTAITAGTYTAGTGRADTKEDSPAAKLANRFITEVDYNYYVPCLQYKSITE